MREARGMGRCEVKQRLQPLAGTSARLQVACGVGEHEAAMIGRMPRRIHRERLDRARHLLRCRVRRRRSVGLELLRLGSHTPASQRATEAEQPTKAVAQRPNDQEAALNRLARREHAEGIRRHGGARRHLRACSREQEGGGNARPATDCTVLADSSHGDSHVGSVSPAATRTRTLALTLTRTLTLALTLPLTRTRRSRGR